MQILSKARGLFLFLCALSSSAYAQEPATDDALQSLVAAEKSFAQMSLEKGMREAFLENLADDAVVFDPGPVNGKELYRKQVASDDSLSWEPIFADIARSGDMGYTTGPWEYKKNKADEKPGAQGQFVSIWKRQADGKWKVALDGGIPNPPPTSKTSAVEILPNESSGPANVDLKAARNALAAAEKEFNEASAKDAGTALIAAAADNIRVFRSGRFPAVGRDAAQLMIGYDHGRMRAKRAGGGISRFGDFAYSYGEYTNERPDGVEHGYFVTIWKMSVGGDWQLAADVRKTQPQEEKKSNE
jgi:ketosteroid isomerase-like protein